MKKRTTLKRKTESFLNFFDEIPEEFKGLSLDDLLYIQDIDKRKLYLEDVDTYSAIDIVKNIIKFNEADKGIDISNRKPIMLYISSPGGNVDAGFMIIDAILNSKTPVYTFNLGYAYSMGFLISLAGHTRFATRNAKFLMHDGSEMCWDSSAKLQDRMKFQEKVEERIKNYVIEHSNISPKEYDEQYRCEWYTFADEAKVKGFVDSIIGEDCEMEDII